MSRMILRLGLGVSLLTFALWVAALLLGSVIVVDGTGQVQSAGVIGDEPLHEITEGVFAAFPRAEGELQILCGNGRRVPGGYVPAGTHIWVRMAHDVPCSPIVSK